MNDNIEFKDLNNWYTNLKSEFSNFFGFNTTNNVDNNNGSFAKQNEDISNGVPVNTVTLKPDEYQLQIESDKKKSNALFTIFLVLVIMIFKDIK